MDDAQIRQQVYEVLATYDTVAVFADVENGAVHIVGEVNSAEQRQEIGDLVARIDGVTRVWNELVVEMVPLEGAHLLYHPETPVEMQVEGGDIAVEGTEYDLNDEIGTTDVMESSSESEPFFPPTDVVVRPTSEAHEGYEVVGGWAGTSMDDNSEGPAPFSGVELGDEQIADNVSRELRQDSLTTDLQVRVSVRNGVVYLRGSVPTPDDAEAAEEVASRVPGVAEVKEELERPSRLSVSLPRSRGSGLLKLDRFCFFATAVPRLPPASSSLAQLSFVSNLEDANRRPHAHNRPGPRRTDPHLGGPKGQIEGRRVTGFALERTDGRTWPAQACCSLRLRFPRSGHVWLFGVGA